MAKKQDIEEQLRRRLQNSKVSRYRLSQISGLSESTLSYFLRGKRGVGMKVAEKLADAMGYQLNLQKKTGTKPKGG